MTGASGGATLSPWLRMPTQLDRREPCHSRVLGRQINTTATEGKRDFLLLWTKQIWLKQTEQDLTWSDWAALPVSASYVLPVVQAWQEVVTLSFSVNFEDVKHTHGVVWVGGSVSGLQVLLNHLHTQQQNKHIKEGTLKAHHILQTASCVSSPSLSSAQNAWWEMFAKKNITFLFKLIKLCLCATVSCFIQSFLNKTWSSEMRRLKSYILVLFTCGIIQSAESDTFSITEVKVSMVSLHCYSCNRWIHTWYSWQSESRGCILQWRAQYCLSRGFSSLPSLSSAILTAIWISLSAFRNQQKQRNE